MLLNAILPAQHGGVAFYFVMLARSSHVLLAMILPAKIPPLRRTIESWVNLRGGSEFLQCDRLHKVAVLLFLRCGPIR